MHYTCAAAAEMGDRFATIDMGRGLRMQGLPASVQQAHDGKLYAVKYGAKSTTPAQQA